MDQVSLNCFKQYDIRGIVGKELNDHFAYQLGRYFPLKKVAIARDSRLSSISLLNALKQGLLDSNCEVIELEGVSTSPLLYYTNFKLNCDASIMITGSHTPLDLNGFKIIKDGKFLFGEELINLTKTLAFNGKGTHKIIDIRQQYSEDLSKNLHLDGQLKILWECNNSGLGLILSRLNYNFKLINYDCNGNFVNNPPDPLEEKSLVYLHETLKKNQFDYGFAVDGDGDRLVLITKNGNALSSEQLTYLIALSLKGEKKNKIILDIKSSNILAEELTKLGFKVLFASGGHSIMKRKILEENAILAAESSGHFVINDGKYYPVDDSLYIALRLIKHLEKNSLVLLPKAKYAHELKVKVKNKAILEKKFLQIKDVIHTLRGIRKNYSNGWWLLRFSNTEDHLLIKIEANNKATYMNLVEELFKITNIQLSLCDF